jgi:hypothetical protein
LIGLLGADDESGSEKAKEQRVAKVWIDRSKKKKKLWINRSIEEEALDRKRSWFQIVQSWRASN